jgi:casein kinase II subunit beta
MIHARFILTPEGMDVMREKYERCDFGRCLRVLCKAQPCLPLGQSDIPHKTTINIFCPRCRQVYFPRSVREANIEGAFFGTTFCHLFLLTFPEYVIADQPRKNTEEKLSGGRIYGFRIGKESRYWTGNNSTQFDRPSSSYDNDSDSDCVRDVNSIAMNQNAK